MQASVGKLTLLDKSAVAPNLIKAMDSEATYTCDSCGEEIVIPIDPSGGARQQYVEDCPVCCHPNVLVIELDETGEARVWSEHE